MPELAFAGAISEYAYLLGTDFKKPIRSPNVIATREGRDRDQVVEFVDLTVIEESYTILEAVVDVLLSVELLPLLYPLPCKDLVHLLHFEE
jgi:hypothetical protein